jgi:TetR/AcrR family transcriptional regulator
MDATKALTVRKAAAAARRAKPRIRDKEATRAAVLEAALSVFCEFGYDGGSTRDIAARANVNHAMIKYYFESKDALWKAAVRFLFDRMNREISYSTQEMENATGEAAMAFAKKVWGDYIRYCARHPDHARLMIQETIRGGERLDWAVEAFIRDQKVGGERMILWMQDRGLVPKVSTPALLFIIVGASQLYYALAPEVRRTWGFDPSDEARVEEHVEALLTVLFR